MNPTITEVARLLADCQRLLLTAGAGLSIDAGIDYADTRVFAERYPGLVARGITMSWQMVGRFDLPSPVLWAYQAIHVRHLRYDPAPQPVYQTLARLCADHDCFVATTNVDALFQRHGFPDHRIHTPQGDYGLLQCATPCTTATWSAKPTLNRLLPLVDHTRTELSDPTAVPRCPNCGGDVRFNVRAGPWFLDQPHRERAAAWQTWLGEACGHRLLVLELGVGHNTPGVLRWPAEALVARHGNAHLVRVNLHHPQIPAELAGQATPLAMRAGDFLNQLDISAAASD